ncbi:MAG TPA: site-2 protease family protein [Candidatus Binataceae bacterium]|jgi:Zn-dependent protease|nr:site-2 protease family protein [Candidatus Binataceae bacterium]
MGRSGGFITTLLIWAVPMIFSIILHEVMHGFVARSLGDDTAQREGRLTLNPLAHIDLFGTLILPAILLFARLPVFGYAKPVPVNFGRLRNGRTGMVMVAAAGPLTNFALAIICALALRLGITNVILTRMLLAGVVFNVMLGVFNLLPLLPLDGGRVLAGLLPLPLARAYAGLERYGFLILLVLLYTGVINLLMDPVLAAVYRSLL